MIRLFFFAALFAGNASAEHVYQYDIRKLGLLGIVDCGPAAVTEAISLLKPAFPLLKIDDDVYSQTRGLADRMDTRLWVNPLSDRWGTHPMNLAKGLRSYFRDSGYSTPWAYVRGFWALEAPEGKTVEEMQKPVTLEEITDYSKRGYGVILLVGLWIPTWSAKFRLGGHYLTILGHENGEFIVADPSTRSSSRRIKITPVERSPGSTYPDHVLYTIDGSDWIYLDSAVIFSPAPHLI